MKQYANILENIIKYGSVKPAAREGLVPTKSLFDCNIEVLDGSLPILNGKRVFTRNVISELVWFLKGYTNIAFLHKYNNHIWDDDAYRFYREQGGILEFDKWLEIVTYFSEYNVVPIIYHPVASIGDCGRIYGYQWRRQGYDNYYFPTDALAYPPKEFAKRKSIDQLDNLINGLIKEPFSRYHILDAWNWQDYKEGFQALPACHNFVQCNVREVKGKLKLDLSVWQRSCDMFLGVPYNLLSYGIFHRLLCFITGYEIGNFKWHGGDCHIYENQMDAVNEYLSRVRDPKFNSPDSDTYVRFDIDRVVENDNYISIIDKINVEDINIIHYNPQEHISAPLNTGVNKWKK